MNPIELMMSEHRLIERVLDSLEMYVGAVGRGDFVDQERLVDYVTFIRGYADAMHHGKEEDILFATVLRRGVPDDLGPLIAGIQREHDIARSLTDDLASAAGRERAWSADERREIERVGREYFTMLRKHIADEDRDVFPRCAEFLGITAMNGVARAFAEFETANCELRAELVALADALIGDQGRAGRVPRP